MITQVRLGGAALLTVCCAVPALAENVLVNLEEPKDESLYSGISNLRGWAVAESGIAAVEIDIDGEYAFNVPMGGVREDVATAYPGFPDAGTSGFSMAYNYKGLPPGDYVFTARAISREGSVATKQATITVDRFVGEYISDVSQVDTSTVTDVTFDEASLTLNGLTVEGRQWNVAMGFDTATQGFQITSITDAESNDVDASCVASQWESGNYTVQQGEIERQFRVRLPEGYDPGKRHPLAVVFHGWGGGQGEFLNDVVVRAESDQRGYVLVAPLGLGEEEAGKQPASWSFSGSTTGLDGDGLNAAVDGDTVAICNDDETNDYTYPSCDGVAANGCSWTQCTADDVAFAADLVAEVSANLCIDAQRVYAVGGSNGGMYVWDLGRDSRTAEIFTAVAAIIGLPHRGFLDPPVLEGGMPAISVTGTRDRTVPPGEWEQQTFTTTSDGDVYHYTGASAITRVWAEAQGCDTSVPAAPVDVGVPNAECRGWSYCQTESQWPPVLDCRADMGHTYRLNWSWPLILDFFEQL